MTSQEEALSFLVRLLEQHQVDYMVIGGLANAVWGEPRIEELSTLLSRPEIWQKWSEWKSESEENL